MTHPDCINCKFSQRARDPEYGGYIRWCRIDFKPEVSTYSPCTTQRAPGFFQFMRCGPTGKNFQPKNTYLAKTRG